MSVKARIGRLEERCGKLDRELIIYITNFSAVPIEKNATTFPRKPTFSAGENEAIRQRIEADIARQRVQGKTCIIVKVPYGYEMQES